MIPRISNFTIKCFLLYSDDYNGYREIRDRTGKLIFKFNEVLYCVEQNKFQNYNILILDKKIIKKDYTNNNYFLTNKKTKKYF